MFKRIKWTAPPEYISIDSDTDIGLAGTMAAGLDNFMRVEPGMYEWSQPDLDEYFEEEDHHYPRS